jgi:hypothetical protein
MGGSLTEEIAEIAAAVEIRLPASYWFAGRAVGPVVAALPYVPGTRPSANPAVDQLAGDLYNYCFTRRFRGADRDVPAADGGGNGGDLTAILSAANASRERWDSGWVVVQVLPTGQVVARKATLDRAFWPGDFVTHDAPGMPPRVGAALSAFLRRESTTVQPGFYFAFGETAVDPLDDDSLIRFYWNVADDAAPLLTRLVTSELNRFQVPYRFKCLTNRAHFYRLDAAVLFVNKRHHRIAAELLKGVYAAVRSGLGPETPLFTKALAPGLALAEDPGSGESFGMSRCRMLAEGLWAAHALGPGAPEARAQAVLGHLAAQGVTPDRPHATGGYADQYDYTQFPA